MLNPVEVSLILAVVMAVLFIADSLRYKESANRVAKQLCIERDVQFLDGTVAFKSLALCWKKRRGPVITRNFRFEFSTNHEDRQRAILSLSTDGTQMISIKQESESPLYNHQ
ncbi:MAG: DUF3301 domain-containing protein [Pseudomonadota bacterium]